MGNTRNHRNLTQGVRRRPGRPVVEKPGIARQLVTPEDHIIVGIIVCRWRCTHPSPGTRRSRWNDWFTGSLVCPQFDAQPGKCLSVENASHVSCRIGAVLQESSYAQPLRSDQYWQTPPRRWPGICHSPRLSPRCFPLYDMNRTATGHGWSDQSPECAREPDRPRNPTL